MRVVFKDLKHGEIKLIPENIDDIWHLYNIIDEGDLVRAVTFRTNEQKDDKIRSKKAEKKRMKLGIRVSEVKFHEFSDRLRIHGTIEEGPQDLGSYHTLNIEADEIDKLSIVKDQWKDYHLQRIDEAVKLRDQSILTFASIDDDSATVAVLRQSGIQWIADIDSKRSGKMYPSKDLVHEYFGEILSVVRTNMEKNPILVVVGPGFSKDHFIKYGKVKEPQLFEKCLVHGTSYSGMNGIQEAIKTGVIEQIIKENRVVFETCLVEKLFVEIKKDGMILVSFTSLHKVPIFVLMRALGLKSDADIIKAINSDFGEEEIFLNLYEFLEIKNENDAKQFIARTMGLGSQPDERKIERIRYGFMCR